MADLVVAARFIERSEALIARSLLESEGVFAFAPDLHALSADNNPGFMESGYRLMVERDQLETALSILRDAQLASTHDPASPAVVERLTRPLEETLGSRPEAEGMLRIGDFARLGRVTIKALRLYDEEG